MIDAADFANDFPKVPSEGPRLRLPETLPSDPEPAFPSSSTLDCSSNDEKAPAKAHLSSEGLLDIKCEVVEEPNLGIAEENADKITEEGSTKDDQGSTKDDQADDIDALLRDLLEFLLDLHGGLEAAQQFRHRITLLSSKNRKASLVVKRRLSVWGRAFGTRGELFSAFMLRSVVNQAPWLKLARLTHVVTLALALLSLFGRLPKHFCAFSLPVALHIIIMWGSLYWDVIKCILLSFQGCHYLAHVIITWVSGGYLLNFDARVCVLCGPCLFWSLLAFIDAAPPFLASTVRHQLFIKLFMRAILPCVAVAVVVSFWFAAIPDLVDRVFNVGEFTSSVSNLFSSSILNVLAFHIKIACHGGPDAAGTTTFYSLPTEVKFQVKQKTGSGIASTSVVSRAQAALRPSFQPSPP